MSEKRNIHCPEGHEVILEVSTEYVEGEKVTRVEAYSTHPHCELCQDLILALREDPEAFEQGSRGPGI